MMMKKRKQALAGLLLACMMTVFLPVWQMVSMAASAKITFSDPSGTVGQEVTVNMKISSGDGSLGSADVMLAYDATALEFISGNSVEGGAGSLRARGGPAGGDLSNIVFSMKFRILKVGNSQITIASQEVYDSNSQAVTISHQGSSTISVSAGLPEGETGEGLLTSLVVAPGSLSPEFSPLIDMYSMHVGLDVEQIQVQALAGEGAQVAVEGSEGLQMGENTITIKVTAPDGVTVKNYTISVTKSEGGETAAGAQAEIVEGVSLEAAAKAITILSPDETTTLPEGFSKTTIDIDGHKVTGWIWAAEAEHQYCIFYAMNAAGERNFYRYDLTEKTIQRYFTDPVAQSGYTKEETEAIIQQYNDLLDDYQLRMYLIIALAAVATVLLILVIVLLVTRNSGKAPKESRGSFYPEERRPEEERSPKKGTMSREERYMLGEEDEEESFRQLERFTRPSMSPEIEMAASQINGQEEDFDFEEVEEEPAIQEPADEDFELMDID